MADIDLSGMSWELLREMMSSVILKETGWLPDRSLPEKVS